MRDGETPLIALPLVLPMGWTESPPAFCTVTETITDLANAYGMMDWNPPPHWLEREAATQPPTVAFTITAPVPEVAVPQAACVAKPPNRIQRKHHTQKRLHHVDVFVDDEIVAAQGNRHQLDRARRHLLHLNDNVFRPNDTLDSKARKEPVSRKKLQQGDACWSTYKTILGWDVDTLQQTIHLPPHRAERLLEILRSVL